MILTIYLFSLIILKLNIYTNRLETNNKFIYIHKSNALYIVYATHKLYESHISCNENTVLYFMTQIGVHSPSLTIYAFNARKPKQYHNVYVYTSIDRLIRAHTSHDIFFWLSGSFSCVLLSGVYGRSIIRYNTEILI